MRSFYTLSGIRVVLFDADYREIIAYPQENCDFCKLMKACAKTRRKCKLADRRSFGRCERQNGLILYKCHAGLVEAAIPLHENEKIIGYLMFGQITDGTSKAPLYESIGLWQEKYGLSPTALRQSIDRIPYRSAEQIHAAAKIMEACTSYILYQELITPENDRIFVAARNYIEEHLQEEISVEQICKALDIGRTKLYEIFRNELKMGVSKYILRRRMHRAKKLLKTGELTVAQVAHSVGFIDYNYFSRVFKKIYGKSPKAYEK